MYVFFLMFVFFSGLFMAVSPIVAQKIGAGRDVREIGSFVRGALVLALIMGCTWVVLLDLVRVPVLDLLALTADTRGRPEERRVGNRCVSPCRSRWSLIP